MSVPRQSHLQVALFSQRAKTDRRTWPPASPPGFQSQPRATLGQRGWLTSPAAGGHLAETCARGAVARCGSGREPGGAGHDALLQPRGSSQCSHQPKRRAEALLNMSAVRTALHLDLKGNNRLRRLVPSTRVTSHRLPPRWNQPWATQKEQKLDLKDVPVTQLSTSLGP